MRPEILKYGIEVAVRDNIFEYDESRQLNLINGIPAILNAATNEATTHTDSNETGDPDEIFGATTLTENVEPSDPDEIFAGSTVVTFTVEEADPDEVFAGYTDVTKAVEAADPDEVFTLEVEIQK